MITSVFEDKDTLYAYHTVQDFFDQYHFSAAIKEIKTVIRAATNNKAWHKDYPYRLVYFMELLNKLCTAAFTIHDNMAIRKNCIIKTDTGDESPNLTNTQHYVSNGYNSTPWNNMPRHLTAAQYNNPYKALQKFVGYMTAAAWKQTCKDLAEYALSNSPADDEYPCYKILQIQLHLLRLTEACHLLEIRSRNNSAT